MAVKDEKKKIDLNTGTGTNNTNTGTGGGNTITTATGYTYGNITPTERQVSEEEQQAANNLSQLQANAPGDWTDPYKDKYMGYLSQYENRDPFSYDFNSDALYQQYKDQYIQQGQMAMMDTMGQAAAMTGGYGNSYAQTVGQQVYNQYLGQLNDKMPELYDRAYNIYQQEGQELLNMYNAYLGLSESDYNKYLGSVDNYYKELGAAQDYYTLLYNKNYGEWADTEQRNLDIWSTNTQIGHSDHTTVQNQNFQAGEAEKDRNLTVTENDKNRAANEKSSAKSDLINLIASTGYEPTDAELAAAGMTRKQANGYKTAYTNAQKTSDAGNAVKYETLTREESTQWLKEGQKQESWSGLISVWNRMKIAKHDPLESASIIKEAAAEKGMKLTKDYLYDFGDKLVAAGVSEDDVVDFIDGWMDDLGIIDPKGAPIKSGSGGGTSLGIMRNEIK